MPTQLSYVAATLNGSPLTGIVSAFCTYGWRRSVPEATLYVKADPAPGTALYNQVLELTLGAGTHNVLSFTGLFRGYSPALWPHAIGLVFRGYMTLLEEFQNRDDPLRAGGLTLLDLLGSLTATDADVVMAVLDRVGVTYTPANIDGTGVTFGSRAPLTNFLWRSGTGTNPLTPLAGAGQSALDHIQEWDRASAVFTDDTSPAGFYRFYETVSGFYRALIGGRPRSTPALTFTEGIDLDIQSVSARDYPLANAVYVTGYDPGLGIGPVRNQDLDATGGNNGGFLGQFDTTFMGMAVTRDYSSPFIEWGTEAEAGIGMNAERVGYALLMDYDRETVTVRFRTPRDELITPGMTILVQGPGGAPGRLLVGENLWVDEVTRGSAEDGEFYQTVVATGGGAPDPTPVPPG